MVCGMGPREQRERPLQRWIDRSHRYDGRRGRRQGRRNPPWTRAEKVVLALDIGLAVGAVVLYVELFLL